MENVSSVIEFTLSGFDDILDYKLTFFFLTLLCYCVIIMINIVVVVTIAKDRNLYEPMYIFICHLCINSLFGTAGFYPKFLLDLLSHHQRISYTGCLLQVLVIYSSVCSDICFLAVMAYDRLVAICRPLEYSSVMTRNRVAQLISFSWLAPLGLISVSAIFTSRLKLCGSNINKLFCANWMIAKLSCAATSWITSTTPGNVIAYVIIMFYLFLGFFIVFSYVQLTRSCHKSLASRGKFMKTCVPHLLALLNISTACLFDAMHMRYGSSNFPQGLQNFLALEIIIGPPLFNPLIYGLTISQIRDQILKPFLQKKLLRVSR